LNISQYSDGWRGSPVWPLPREMTPLNFFLQNTVNGKVYTKKSTTMDHPSKYSELAFHNLDERKERYSHCGVKKLCLNSEGGYFYEIIRKRQRR
jgi:hypothetical protein